jgi:hypothetical protein
MGKEVPVEKASVIQQERLAKQEALDERVVVEAKGSLPSGWAFCYTCPKGQRRMVPKEDLWCEKCEEAMLRTCVDCGDTYLSVPGHTGHNECDEYCEACCEEHEASEGNTSVVKSMVVEESVAAAVGVKSEVSQVQKTTPVQHCSVIWRPDTDPDTTVDPCCNVRCRFYEPGFLGLVGPCEECEEEAESEEQLRARSTRQEEIHLAPFVARDPATGMLHVCTEPTLSRPMKGMMHLMR